MNSIFISYSSKDRPIADYIAAELRNRGADVFVDYQKLVAGESFIGRLGQEIEKRDCLVLLLSPHSVTSKWVQAEVAWAFTKNKPIIPVLLDPDTSLTDFFFLINLEQVNFTRWAIDGDVSEAVAKLARALEIPEAPIQADNSPRQPSPTPQVKAELEETGQEPILSYDEIDELFLSAADIADQDPEQAVFLYRRVLEIDPYYGRGQARKFVEREEIRLKPARMLRLKAQAEVAMKLGEWKQAERLTREILVLDVENFEAQRILATCMQNAECEPVYERAVTAIQKGRWGAAISFLRDVKVNCPAYDDPAGILIIQAKLASFLKVVATLRGHEGTVDSVIFSPDGMLLASGSRDNTIRLWDVEHRHELDSLKAHNNFVNSVAFSPDNRLMVSSSNDKTIRLWDIANRRQLTVLTAHEDWVFHVALSSNGKLLASGSRDNMIRLWDVESRQELALLVGHVNWVRSVAFSPNNRLLASGSDDGTIGLWDVETMQQIAAIPIEKGEWVFSVAFSPDGNLLACGSSDKIIRLWNLQNGQQIAALAGHEGAIHSVVFSPDGKLLASSSDDRTIRLWDVEFPQELFILKEHNSYVRSVAFSPDGRLLASGSKDRTIKLWGLA